MVGERFPKQAQEGLRKFPGTLQDFETLNLQKMVGERFPTQEVRQEALTTRGTRKPHVRAAHDPATLAALYGLGNPKL